MKKLYRQMVCHLLVFALFLSCAGAALADEVRLAQPVILTAFVDGEERTVQAVEAGSDYNTYVSLRSLSSALSGSGKQFSYEYVPDYYGAAAYFVKSGEAYEGADGMLETDESVYLTLKRYRIYADDTERKYYCCEYGDHDIFMSLSDVQFMLGLCLDYVPGQEGGKAVLMIDTIPQFMADFPALAETGILESVRALVVGDVNTGEILFSYNAAVPLSIGSLSKLMTYILLREKMTEDSSLRTDTQVTVSPDVIALSKSENGILPLKEGAVLTLGELIAGTMVPSSNECALALAELVGGTEEHFAELMNLRAKRLGLKTAVFYNSTGLPFYTCSAFPAKLQNIMSAADLFELVSFLLSEYPDVTQVTSQQYIRLDSIDYSMANSNPLVFNLPGVNGLKTGTTDRAGYSLAATLPVTVTGGETHTIAVIELGAETQSDRGRLSELALRWARDYCAMNGFAHAYPGK